MRSLSPSDYESMPLLAAPAGYICVIRDIDSDRFRIDGTHDPAAFISAIMEEAERSFGIEIVSILETADLKARESELFARHHARLSEAWHELDALQLEELRRSFLQIDAHSSHYLTPKRTRRRGPALARPQSRYETLARAYLDAPGLMNPRERQRLSYSRGRQPSQPPLFKSYGVESLRRRGRRRRESARPPAEEPTTLRARIKADIKHLMSQDLGCSPAAWACLLIAGLALMAALLL